MRVLFKMPSHYYFYYILGSYVLLWHHCPSGDIHRTRTSTMFIKKSIKIYSFACQLSVKQVLIACFFEIFCISITNPKKNFIKMYKKN